MALQPVASHQTSGSSRKAPTGTIPPSGTRSVGAPPPRKSRNAFTGAPFSRADQTAALDIAWDILDDLGTARYHEMSAKYFGARLEASSEASKPAVGADLPTLLGALAGAVTTFWVLDSLQITKLSS